MTTTYNSILNININSGCMGSLGSAMSSPGSAPGTPLGVGFPIRRHSSAFAANRRYSSNALLSPSTAAQVSFDEFFSGFS